MALEFKLPDIGEGIAEGEIVAWHVKPGDTIQEDQTLVEVMTDKITVEIPSPVAGTVDSLNANPGDVVKVGSVIVVIQTGNAQPSQPKAQPKSEESAEASQPAETAPSYQAVGASAANGTTTASRPTANTSALAAPATRKLARTMDIDIAQVTGTGPRGRVTPEDVKNFTSQPSRPATAGNGHSTSTPAVQAPRFTPGNGQADQRVPFAGIRRRIAEHLVHAKHTAPHFAYVDEVDMTDLVALRAQLKDVARERQVKLTYLPFVIKAVIEGLRAFPILNSSLDDARQELVYRGDFNIGIAMDTEQGLVVPVIHHADRHSILELAAAIEALATKAKNNKLSLDDMKGGTFTVTSIGSIGGLFGIPIINHPEVAIMGINTISKRPVVRNDAIVIRQMMHLSLSCDHRVVDGAVAARFTNAVIQALENPARLLL